MAADGGGTAVPTVSGLWGWIRKKQPSDKKLGMTHSSSFHSWRSVAAFLEAAKVRQAPKNTQSAMQIVRRLYLLAAPEGYRIGAACAAMSLTSLSNLMFPKIIGRLIDHFQSNQGSTTRFALVSISIFAVGAAGSWIRTYLFAISAESVARRLRKQLMRTILTQEIGFFDDHRTAELVSRLHEDVNATANATTSHIAKSYRYLNSALGGSCMLFALSPRLTLMSMTIVPVMASGAMIYGMHTRKLSRKLKARLSASMAVAEERIASIRTVRLFGQELGEANGFDHLLDEMSPMVNASANAEGLLMGGLSFLGFTSLLLVLCYGGRLVSRGKLTVGALTSFAMYSATVGLGFSGLSQLYAEILKTTASAQRVFELIDREPQVDQNEGIKLVRVEGHLSICDVCFSYPTRPGAPVLDNLSLELEAGKILAVAGASGGGKSTIAHLLTRLYEPDSGHILLDGVNIRSLSAVWLRRQIVVVNQEPLLFATSLLDNIRYGQPEASMQDVADAAKKARCTLFIDTFPDGYNTYVGEKGTQLSGGQKQRVAIARAIIRDPKILILDEATNGLDGESERHVTKALALLMRGRTTLVISHRVSTLASAHKIAMIEGGTVVEQGTYEHLLAEENGAFKILTESLRG